MPRFEVLNLIEEALQHMYFTMPHRKKEIEQYCAANGIILSKVPNNSFEPEEFWRIDD